MHSHNTSSFQPFSWNIRGNLHVFNQPVIMGIINATPDSFFAGSRLQQEEEVLAKAAEMLDAGAEILDIGGYSTRPGAKTITPDEEQNRVIPLISVLHQNFPQALISIDTFRASTAAAAVDAGASIVNDIGAGLLDDAMLPTVAQLKAPYIYMHMQGTPATMQLNPQYQDVTLEVLDFLRERKSAILAAGIADSMADPGFGFGKNLEHNFRLLKELTTLQVLNSPLLVGISRKSMISRTLGITAAESLNGTTALHMLALQNGASMLRVHDVKPAKEAVLLWQSYLNA